MKRTLVLCGLLVCLSAGRSSAEQVQGKACYRFSDNESVSAARNIVLSLAKRDALESYQVFVASTSQVENAQLKNDLITSLGSGVLKRLTVVSNTEDLSKRELCVQIRGDIDPVEAKAAIASSIAAFQGVPPIERTGLPANKYFRVIRTTEVKRTGPYENDTLEVIVYCLPRRDRQGRLVGTLRLTFYDSTGMPFENAKQLVSCEAAGDVTTYSIPIPQKATNKILEIVK